MMATQNDAHPPMSDDPCRIHPSRTARLTPVFATFSPSLALPYKGPFRFGFFSAEMARRHAVMSSGKIYTCKLQPERSHSNTMSASSSYIPQCRSMRGEIYTVSAIPTIHDDISANNLTFQ